MRAVGLAASSTRMGCLGGAGGVPRTCSVVGGFLLRLLGLVRLLVEQMEEYRHCRLVEAEAEEEQRILEVPAVAHYRQQQRPQQPQPQSHAAYEYAAAADAEYTRDAE